MLALAACRDGTGLLARRPISVSFTATPTSRALRSLGTTSGASLFMAPSGASFAAVAGEEVIVDKVELVLSHIELAKAVASCTTGRKGSEGECEDIQLDPMLVSVPVSSTVKTLVTTPVPEGIYGAFHATIDVVRPGDDQQGAKAFLDANPGFAGVSLKVYGTYKKSGAADQKFVYTSTAKGEIETEFAPPLDVSKSNMNVTVELDVSGWFRSPTGVINPISPTSADAAMIDANIRKSLKAFEDNDKDGVPDKR
jgi:hypothetical protein